MIPAVVALVLLNLALALPQRFAFGSLAPTFAIELPLLLAALWLTPSRRRGLVASFLAIALVFVIVLRAANTAIFIAFDRPFDPSTDFGLVTAGWDLAVRSHGWAFVLGAAALGAIALVGIGLMLRLALCTVAYPRHRWTVIGIAAASAVVMLLLPSTWRRHTTASLVASQVRVTAAGFHRQAEFSAAMAQDPLHDITDDRLYAALRGHDVLVVFVESYGRVAVDDRRYEAIDSQLDTMTAHLQAAGIGARSAWLTSPTFGGESWFAHGTLMSGLWVNDQHRFDTLVHSDHPSMIADFRRAGWRTIAVMPEITGDWPAGRYFAPDAIYDAPALAYGGEPFAYVTMPDQFTLAQIRTKELSKSPRPALMAEIALVSSHAPWTPLPKIVPWQDIGNGAVFDRAREGDTPEKVWADPEAVRVQYGRSVSYVLSALEDFVLTYADDRTVLIVLGDHQPMSFISGEDASRDVPVHIIARDPAVLARLDAWHWTAGMRPDTTSPIWRMDEMRARLAHAFSAASTSAGP